MPPYFQCLQQLQSTIQISPRNVLDIPKGYKRAAVLVPIYIKQDDWYILFTRRTEKVTHHKNEISFPGGGFEENVDNSIIETAIREIEEEIVFANEKFYHNDCKGILEGNVEQIIQKNGLDQERLLNELGGTIEALRGRIAGG